LREAWVSEYREDFVQALRNGKKLRTCMFSVLEQRHATDFANGPTGVRYYNELFEAVRAAEVPEALEEFQTRFLPMLDPDGTRARAAQLPTEATPQTGREARWMVAACSAAVLLAGAILGLNAFPRAAETTPPPMAEPTAVTAATTIAAEPTLTVGTIAAEPAVTVGTIADDPAPTTETTGADSIPVPDLAAAAAEPPAISREPTEIRGDE
jgi:hypothetical protein